MQALGGFSTREIAAELGSTQGAALAEPP
jgi:DNA-directed RNA polymerase specialized sigma24 family protein